MEYMKLKALKVGLSKDGNDLSVGDEFETDAASGASLVADGWAEENDAVEAPNSAENVEGEKDTVKDQDGAEIVANSSTDAEPEDTTKDPDATEPEDADPTGSAERVRKALDGQYKRDEIYEAAIRAGVEIAYDAKKAEIIEAVITQDAALALLK